MRVHSSEANSGPHQRQLLRLRRWHRRTRHTPATTSSPLSSLPPPPVLTPCTWTPPSPRYQRVCEWGVLVCWRKAIRTDEHGGRRHLRLLRRLGRARAAVPQHLRLLPSSSSRSRSPAFLWSTLHPSSHGTTGSRTRVTSKLTPFVCGFRCRRSTTGALALRSSSSGCGSSSCAISLLLYPPPRPVVPPLRSAPLTMEPYIIVRMQLGGIWYLASTRRDHVL